MPRTLYRSKNRFLVFFLLVLAVVIHLLGGFKNQMAENARLDDELDAEMVTVSVLKS